MKKQILCLAMLLLAISSWAQDRVSTSIPTVGKEVLWTLSSATGWIKNKEGQWIEGSNKVQWPYVSVTHKEEWDKEQYSLGIDNFIRYELRSITVGGVAFLLLTKILNEGNWKYPYSHKEWMPKKRVEFLVFKKDNATMAEDQGFNVYKSAFFYNGSVAFTPAYLDEIAMGISTLDTKRPEVKNGPGLVGYLEVYYKEMPDKKNSRFYIGASGEIPQSQSMQPKLPVEPLTFAPNFYYEGPAGALDGLRKVLGKAK